jgi:hypothetical protein
MGSCSERSAALGRHDAIRHVTDFRSEAVVEWQCVLLWWPCNAANGAKAVRVFKDLLSVVADSEDDGRPVGK